MSKKEAKLMYISMMELDELHIFMPNATTIWENDKEEFIRLYEINTIIPEEITDEEEY